MSLDLLLATKKAAFKPIRIPIIYQKQILTPLKNQFSLHSINSWKKLDFLCVRINAIGIQPWCPQLVTTDVFISAPSVKCRKTIRVNISRLHHRCLNVVDPRWNNVHTTLKWLSSNVEEKLHDVGTTVFQRCTASFKRCFNVDMTLYQRCFNVVLKLVKVKLREFLQKSFSKILASLLQSLLSSYYISLSSKTFLLLSMSFLKSSSFANILLIIFLKTGNIEFEIATETLSSAHGDLYKQAMKTFVFTKKVKTKVFYSLISYQLNSEKYYNITFATELWIWVLLIKIKFYKLQIYSINQNC